LRFTIADLELANALRQRKIRNQKSKNYLKTPRRGQSAECPDRLITKKAADFSSNFFGITPAPQYSLNLTTKSASVKPPKTGDGCRVSVIS
jgi:hypothetical protein